MALRWSYTLSHGSNLQSTGFSIVDEPVVGIGKIFHTSGIATVFERSDFRTRFNISRSEVATLIINRVTEREEAVYECELETVTNKWRYRICVIVTGENYKKEFNFNFSILNFNFFFGVYMSGRNYTCKDMIHESLLLFLVQLLKREKKNRDYM